MGRQPQRPIEMRRHLKAEVGLSPAARALIDAAFETGSASYEAIARQVFRATGEKIGKTSVGRYWREWNVRRRAREARSVALVQLAGLRKLPAAQLDEVIEQLLRTAAFEELAQAEPGTLDPGKLIRALTARERVKLARAQQEMAARRLEQRAATDLDRVLEMWRDIVGLVQGADSAAAEALRATSDKVIDGLKARYA